MRVANSPLFWVANNSSKPGRSDAADEENQEQWWVLHATPEWTNAHVDEAPETVASALIAALAELTGSAEQPTETLTHRWLYPRLDCRDEAQPGHIWFADSQLGLAGDWLAGGRIEGAYNSSASLVGAIGDAATV